MMKPNQYELCFNVSISLISPCSTSHVYGVFLQCLTIKFWKAAKSMRVRVTIEKEEILV